MSGVDVYASCIVIGRTGLLIRGPSGAGKSALAATLVERAQAQGQFAGWVADDRVALTECAGRLVARPQPSIAGLAEMRFLGPVPTKGPKAALVDLVVDLEPADTLERLPDPCRVSLAPALAIALPLIRVPRENVGLCATIVFTALENEVWGPDFRLPLGNVVQG